MKNNTIDYSGRIFRIWKYSISLNTLLLRSKKENSTNCNIDILFRGVSFINLPTTLNGIVIKNVESKNNSFNIVSNKIEYQVIANSISIDENNKNYDDLGTMFDNSF